MQLDGHDTHPRKTTVKENAGGHNVLFQETFSWTTKGLYQNLLKIKVKDWNMTFADETLGEKDYNLNLLELPEDGEKENVPLDLSHNMEPAGTVLLTFSRRLAPKGAFAGTLHVTIAKIDEFDDKVGMISMDTTDPYVKLQLMGRKPLKTSTKDNAGGKNVEFNEVLSFFDKGLFENMLTITVMDSNTLMDQELGEVKFNVNELELPEDGEKEHVVNVMKPNSQESAGKCHLLFSRKEAPAGAFAGTLYVTVHRISSFPDKAGFMDTTDPYVKLELANKESQKTTVLNNAGGNAEFNESFLFRKELFDGILRVLVMDSETVTRDAMLGELNVNLNDLHLQPDIKQEVTLEMLKPNCQDKAGDCVVSFLRKEVPEGSFEGICHITVIGIKGFSSKSDPYVSLQLGVGKPQKTSTSTKDKDSGNVDFSETLTFENKGIFDNLLKIRVMDSGKFQDAVLGLCSRVLVWARACFSL